MLHRWTDHIYRAARWLRRFRNRRGYGIHSPFAFQLVTGVIYGQERFYAYDRLETLYRQRQNHDCQNGSGNRLRLKDCKLLFRLTNDRQPAHCLIGSRADCDLMEAFVKAACPQTEVIRLQEAGEESSAKAAGAGRLLGIAEATRPDVALRILQGADTRCGDTFMLTALRTKAGRHTWKRLLHEKTAQVCFDLGDLGIIICDDKLQRQRYTINYY